MLRRSLLAQLLLRSRARAARGAVVPAGPLCAAWLSRHLSQHSRRRPSRDSSPKPRRAVPPVPPPQDAPPQDAPSQDAPRKPEEGRALPAFMRVVREAQAAADAARESKRKGKAQDLAERALRRSSDLADAIAADHERHQLSLAASKPEVVVVTEGVPVPQLATNLRRVLDQPGTHSVRLESQEGAAPHFSEHFAKVLPPDEFNWEAVAPFVSSSRDATLASLVEKHDCRVFASTSSCTGILSHIVNILTCFRHIDTSVFSPIFAAMPRSLTRSARKPARAVLRKRANGRWGLDSMPSMHSLDNEILMELGKSIERYLTTEPETFKKTLLAGSPPDTKLSSYGAEPYRYVKRGSLMVRAQLDCSSDGTYQSVFDLKTRATNPIRLDVVNYDRYLNYQLGKYHGLFHSFEREWYDMSRAAFLKYILQCRLGMMTGVMVTFHNTRDVFGYEFVKLEDMERIMFGNAEVADACFAGSIRLFEHMLNVITTRFADEKCIKLTVDAKNRTHTMGVFVELLRDETAEEAHVRARFEALLAAKAAAASGDPGKSDVEAAVGMSEEQLRTTSLSHDRLNDLLRLDLMSDEQLRSRAVEMDLDPVGTRLQVLGRIELAMLMQMEHIDDPPNKYFSRLASKGLLYYFEMDLNFIVPRSGTSGPRHVVGELRAPVSDVKSSFSFLDMTLKYSPATLGDMYRRASTETPRTGSSLTMEVPDPSESHDYKITSLTHGANRKFVAGVRNMIELKDGHHRPIPTPRHPPASKISRSEVKERLMALGISESVAHEVSKQMAASDNTKISLLDRLLAHGVPPFLAKTTVKRWAYSIPMVDETDRNSLYRKGRGPRRA